MRLLCFRGRFGYLPEDIQEGLAVLCHVESETDHKLIERVSKKICSMSDTGIMLVPFVHLHERTAPPHVAEKVFDALVQACEQIGGTARVTRIPFGIKKEFHLYASAEYDAIHFLHF